VTAPPFPPSSPIVPVPKPAPPSDGLIFEAHWSNGQTTRMSVYGFIKNPDIARALRVSRAALSARLRVPLDQIEAVIENAHFEQEGAIVKTCTADELVKAAVPS
jgi:hypothetical protein